MVDDTCVKLNSININVFSLQDIPNFASPERHSVQGTSSPPCNKIVRIASPVIVHLIFPLH